MIDNELYSLIPNKSLGLFGFNQPLNDSIKYKHEISYVETDPDTPPYVTVLFPEMEIEVTTLNINGVDIIHDVSTEKACYLNGDNIIGMPISVFKDQYGNPDKTDIIFLPRDDRQTHHVYDYDSLGLQLWTWRNRIVEIVAYDINSLGDE